MSTLLSTTRKQFTDDHQWDCTSYNGIHEDLRDFDGLLFYGYVEGCGAYWIEDDPEASVYASSRLSLD